jgi:cell division protein FtsL
MSPKNFGKNEFSQLLTIKRTVIILLVCLIIEAVNVVMHSRVENSYSNKEPWSSEQTKNLYTGLYSHLGDVFTNTDRSKIANCILDKLKSKYPKGFDSINKDSLAKQTELLGEDCMRGLVLHFTWSQALINKLKERATTAPWFKSIEEKNKDKFCDCYVDHLKEMHPNGIVKSLSQSDIDSAVTFCKIKFKLK